MDFPGNIPSADYLRRARRIRAMHREHPGRKQRALKELVNGAAGQVFARQNSGAKFSSGQVFIKRLDLQDSNNLRRRVQRRNWSDSSILSQRSGKASDFADLVAARSMGSLLTQSNRVWLLKEADSRGIGRFEANLIIAAVLHQTSKFNLTGKMMLRATSRQAASPNRFRFPAWLATVVALQILIVSAVWMIFIH